MQWRRHKIADQTLHPKWQCCEAGLEIVPEMRIAKKRRKLMLNTAIFVGIFELRSEPMH